MTETQEIQLFLWLILIGAFVALVWGMRSLSVWAVRRYRQRGN